MDTLQPEPDPGTGLQRLIDDRALAILADFRPGTSNGITPGTFPGLLQSLEDRVSGLRVIGVCGDNGNAAGARVAEGLALSAAKTGRRTLVIDTDARSPRQHILWNGPGSPIGPGLRDTVVAGLPVPPDAIHPTRLSNCRLIPMGYPGDIPDPELFAHVHLEKLLGVHAPAMADTVVVAMPSLDTGAMCAAVGIHMDAVLVVLGPKAGTDVVGAHLDRLLESGTLVAGVVIVPAGEDSPGAARSVAEAMVPIFPPPNPFAEPSIRATPEPVVRGGDASVAAASRGADAGGVVDRNDTTDPSEGVASVVPATAAAPEDIAADAPGGVGHANPLDLSAVSETESVSGIGNSPASASSETPDDARADAAGSEPGDFANTAGGAEEKPVETRGEAEGSVGIDDLSSLLNGWRRRSFAPVVPEPVRPGADGPVAEPAWNLLPLEREEWTRGTLGDDAGMEPGRGPVTAPAPPPVPAEESTVGTEASSAGGAPAAQGLEPIVGGDTHGGTSAPSAISGPGEQSPTPGSEPANAGPANRGSEGDAFAAPVVRPDGPLDAGAGPTNGPDAAPATPAAASAGSDVTTGHGPPGMTSGVSSPAAERIKEVNEESVMDNFASLGGGTGAGAVSTAGVSGNPAVFEIVPNPGGRLTLSASTVLTSGRESMPARVELSVDSSSLRSMRGTSPESAHGAMVLDIQVADTRSGCGLRLLHGDELTAVLEVIFEPGAGFRFASGPGGASAPRISFETTQDGGTLFRAQSQWIEAELLRRQGPGADPSHWTFRLQLAPGR